MRIKVSQLRHVIFMTCWGILGNIILISEMDD